MNSKKFSEAMSELDSKYVDEAINYKKKAKKPVWVKWGVVAACLCLVVVGTVYFTRYNDGATFDPITDYDDSPSDSPATFYYGGGIYCYHGDLVYELPENVEFLGEVNNVGETYSSAWVDMDGNVDGYIFMDTSDKTFVYFQWKEWDEAVDGKESYLILTLEENSNLEGATT